MREPQRDPVQAMSLFIDRRLTSRLSALAALLLVVGAMVWWWVDTGPEAPPGTSDATIVEITAPGDAAATTSSAPRLEASPSCSDLDVAALPDAPTRALEQSDGKTIEFAAQGAGTPDQRAEAADLLKATCTAVIANRLTTVDDAVAAGYEPMFGDPSHYYRIDYVLDSDSFDPEHPEFLVFNDQDVIIGVMYGEPSLRLNTAPPPGSPFLRWHYHEWPFEFCLQQRLVPVGLATDGACPAGQLASFHSPLMVHVWLRGDGDMFGAGMNGHDHHS